MMRGGRNDGRGVPNRLRFHHSLRSVGWVFFVLSFPFVYRPLVKLKHSLAEGQLWKFVGGLSSNEELRQPIGNAPQKHSRV